MFKITNEQIEEYKALRAATKKYEDYLRSKLISTPCDLKPEDVTCIDDAITIYNSTGAFGFDPERRKERNIKIETPLFLETRCFIESETSESTSNTTRYTLMQFDEDYKDYHPVGLFYYIYESLEEALQDYNEKKTDLLA